MELPPNYKHDSLIDGRSPAPMNLQLYIASGEENHDHGKVQNADKHEVFLHIACEKPRHS